MHRATTRRRLSHHLWLHWSLLLRLLILILLLLLFLVVLLPPSLTSLCICLDGSIGKVIFLLFTARCKTPFRRSLEAI
jgi:hypothetical protein